MTRSSVALGGVCASCRHFLNDPAAFEDSFAGILILSSGYGDTRGSQGLCQRWGQLADPHMTCRSFAPRSGRPPPRD